MTQTVVLERYRLDTPIEKRFGGEAFLAQDQERGTCVEVHLVPADEGSQRAYVAVKQAIEALADVAPGPLARPLDLEWGPEGELVLVEDYREGRPLAAVMREQWPSPDQSREVLRALLHALAQGTRVGVPHGGLSPWRVVVGPQREVALLDLGAMPLAPAAPDVGPYRAPGDVGGARADGYAFAVMALELLGGSRPERGRPGPLPPPAVEAVGESFCAAVTALARADGSAKTHDAGALLSLLPPRRTRTRRGRLAVREVWDGEIGGGTARLLKLAMRPEYRDRMPDEIRGQAAAPAGGDEAPDELQFIHTLPGVMLERPRTSRRLARPAAAADAPAAEDAPGAGEPRGGTSIKVTPRDPAPAPAEAEPEIRVTARPSAPTVDAPAPPEPTPATGADRDPATIDLPPPSDALMYAETIPPPHAREAASTVAPRLPEPLVLRAEGAGWATFLVASQAAFTLGRERGNDVILRAFKGGQVEGVDSNRISRRHLGIRREGGRLVAQDNRSTYGTSLDGRRLPPREAAPLPAAFELQLAQTSLRMRGRADPGAGAVRLARTDGVDHHYVLLWAEAETCRAGSSEEDDLLLVPGSGVVPGHAWVKADLATGAFMVAARDGAVRVDGEEVPAGSWVEVGPKPVTLGQARLTARPASAADFLCVGAELRTG